MSFLPQFRASLSRSSPTSTLARASRRTLVSTSPRLSTTGYGDPESEKPEAETGSQAKPPSGAESKAPQGQGGAVRSAGAKEGSGDKGKEDASAKEMKETKKVGEEPKKTEEGGAGPIGG